MTRTRALVVVALGLVVVERVLHVVLSRVDVVHVLLAPGAHSGVLALVLAMVFLALRVVVWVGLPAAASGWLAWQLLRRGARWMGARHARALRYASRAGPTSGAEETCPSDTT